MIKQIVNKHNLNDQKTIKADLDYWLRQPVAERIAAVEFLRKQWYGSTAGLQRTVKIIQRS
ncbi:MAG: hypothetical protein AAB019_05930 [Planctomycetota bacterium]